MSLHPKSAKDLSLAPVAAAIDVNLQRLRGHRSVEGIEFELSLELDRPPAAETRDERAMRVLAVALRDVDLHGWNAEITDDGSGVRLTGGSVSLDLSVGAPVQRYVGEASLTPTA